MEAAKETFHRMTHHNGGSAQKTGLGQDVDPKPAKVHLGDDDASGELSVYVPSGKLKGKTALITGGDSGIGRAVAILFAMEGAKVGIVYLPSEEEDAQHTRAQVEKNGGSAVLIPADLSHASNCREVAARVKESLGTVDVLVNNAATRTEQGDISDISEDQWETTFRVNLDSYFYLTKFLLPLMSGGGVIINSTSVDAYIGVPSRLDYSTSKGAIVAFTRALSNQLVKKGIRVNAVAAGPVRTPLMETGVGKEGKHGHGLGNWTPMDRVGQPVEVATSYVFLASRESRFMSGQTLHPNGGIVVNG